MTEASRPAPLPSSASDTVIPRHPQADERLGRWLMIAAMVISGTIGYFVLMSGQPALNVVFLRCLIGAASLCAWCAYRGYWRGLRMARWQVVNVTLGAITLVSNWYFLFTAYRLTSVGITTVVYNVQPFLLVLAGVIVTRERPSLATLGCLGVAFAGLVILAEPGGVHGAGYLTGVASALAAATLYAATTLFTKRLAGTIRPEIIAALHMVIGAAVFVWMADFHHLPSAPREIGAVVTLGLFHTTFMYLLLYGAFQKASTSSLAVFGFVYPVVAVAVDFLAFGIVLHPTQWLGGVMILLAAGFYARGLGVTPAKKAG
ncbi:EamA family transporter [Pandoraea fibrosis]|uniref:EamA family transporter n=1 Tax=Pandoraea fibrosis TaxID=1891094 RepID=A0ABX6HMU3_9BURK|nr:DMT family transporter [Pandoraea fibrosis]QHE90764.1 EamA family transporter [Pandoraea fibrosis]QHF11595.1 EamA family transporter [Pandoraea fibrosis]